MRDAFGPFAAEAAAAAAQGLLDGKYEELAADDALLGAPRRYGLFDMAKSYTDRQGQSFKA